MTKLINILISGKAIMLYEVLVLGGLIIYLVIRAQKKKAEKEKNDIRMSRQRNEKLDKLLRNPEWKGDGSNYSDPYEVKYLDHISEKNITQGGQIEISVESKTSIKKYDFDIGQEITVGRGKDNALWIENKSVSRKQCVIFPEGKNMYVKNLSSTNHTILKRGSRSKTLGDAPVPIKEKDTIIVGEVNLTLTYHL